MRKLDAGWMRILAETVRRGSFSSAATALGLSQPAVSYQIKRLEEQTGFAVLERHRHGVELTAKGRRLYEIAERAVAETDALMREYGALAERPSLRLHTDYAFSSLWLIPRMHAFRLLYPEIDIQIVATQRLRREDVEDSDIAIPFGEQGDFDPSASILLREEVVPVCTRDYLDRSNLLADPAMLARARLIHLDALAPAPWFDWSRYFDGLGLTREPADHDGDISFNTYSLVTQAASEDQGIALGWMGLVDGLLRSRVLVTAGPPLQAPHRGYWLVPPRSPGKQSQRLVSWLLSEAGKIAACFSNTEPCAI